MGSSWSWLGALALAVLVLSTATILLTWRWQTRQVLERELRLTDNVVHCECSSLGVCVDERRSHVPHPVGDGGLVTPVPGAGRIREVVPEDLPGPRHL